jgi:hypothetical protein
MNTLAARLCLGTLDRLQTRWALRETGAPYITLTNERMPAPVGSLRLFAGGPVAKLVYIGMSVPFINLDSHMIFAFTAPESAVPHFTLDSVFNDGHFAFHLDLIPRVDLGVNLDYINTVHHPLTEPFQATKQIEGLSPAQLSPRQYAIMSPWMLVYRATETAFAQIEGSVNAYLDHWFGLAETGLPPALAAQFDSQTLAERDRRNRAIIFSPDVDPVWAQVDRLVGPAMSARMRGLLQSQSLEE